MYVSKLSREDCAHSSALWKQSNWLLMQRTYGCATTWSFLFVTHFLNLFYNDNKPYCTYACDLFVGIKTHSFVQVKFGATVQKRTFAYNFWTTRERIPLECIKNIVWSKFSKINARPILCEWCMNALNILCEPQKKKKANELQLFSCLTASTAWWCRDSRASVGILFACNDILQFYCELCTHFVF